ncbi:MAG: N-formylglutamate amidohydrolase [Roseiarcus sp.]
MTAGCPDWLIVECRDAPLIVSIPHAGADLLKFEPAFVDPWLARKDADRRLGELYDFLAPLGATVLRTRLSRSIIDVNRDPSGASLHPGQATTELASTTSFDGEPLYRPGLAPEIAERRRLYFDPYHAALSAEITRLRETHKRVALFDAHSIRSVIPRLFDGELPASTSARTPARAAPLDCAKRSAHCSPRVGKVPSSTGASRAAGLRAAYGKPSEGVEALQLELACRAYMREPERPAPENCPTPIDETRVAPTGATLLRALEAILEHMSQ